MAPWDRPVPVFATSPVRRLAPWEVQVQHVLTRMALSVPAQSIRRHRLSGASRLQQAPSLRPRVRKLATRPSSRPKFSSGAAAPRSLKFFISCSQRRRRAEMIIPPPTKFRVPGRNQVPPGRASDADAKYAAQEAPRLRWKPPGLPQSRCSAAARPYPAAYMMRSVADGSR